MPGAGLRTAVYIHDRLGSRSERRLVKHLAPHDRPREKLARLGTSALGDNELLAVILGHGSGPHTALDLANAMLAAVDGLTGLTRIDHDALRRVPGVGAARAGQVLAAVELGRRTLFTRTLERLQFASPRELAAYLLPQYGARNVEQSGVVLLDTRHRLLKTVLIGIGTADATVVHPRDVFREAAIAGAALVVLFHNHPTGDPAPSEADTALTDRLAAAGALMGIELLDHIILADSRYHSFREMGHFARPRR
jgi:DNA repair protein RadC